MSWDCLLPIARQILLHAVQSEALKDLLMETLKELAKHTTNQVDDELVLKLEEALYSNKNKLN
tara:strand:+ start:1179 stop:1367 length:189 start_codon:yes stop_codon:yes gene_type:complete